MEHDEPLPDGEPPIPASIPPDGAEAAAERDAPSPSTDDAPETPELLARVRFGLGKELRLYPDEFVVAQLEAGEELRLRLSSVRRLVLAPGEQVPSKLVLMFDLDDGTTIIAADGMSNVRDFRKLLARLVAIKPDLELDPPNMDEQLMQALDIRRRSMIGCYGSVVVACLIIWLVYMVVALLPHLAAHGTH